LWSACLWRRQRAASGTPPKQSSYRRQRGPFSISPHRPTIPARRTLEVFRGAGRKTGQLTTNPLFRQDAHRIIGRRAKAAGVETRIGNHAFCASGTPAYLKNSSKLEVAQQIANHESPRTTKLYNRRQDEISLDEIERIAI
jgi:Phage integrase family